jgi:catechol 2,3-dioxygenase-like lactoylglutathione lyase family enzyme
MATIDHLILNVNDIEASVAFYANVLGFTREGQEGPFTVIRVSDDFTLQLAPWGTKGNEHYAFALPGLSSIECLRSSKRRAFLTAIHSIRLVTTLVPVKSRAPKVPRPQSI